MYEKIATSITKRGKYLPHDTLNSNIFPPPRDIVVVMLYEYVIGRNL